MYSKIDGKIYSEGYCCPWAYYQLVIIRKQSTRDVAKNFGIHSTTVFYFQKRCKSGKESCRGHEDCMKETIEDLKKT